MLLAQSPFLCAAVGQKDCATTAFRCRFAAAACCHGRSVPLYRRTGVLSIPTHPPSLELSFRARPTLNCHSVVIPSQSADWRGNPFSPRPQARNPFLRVASGGHLSFNSERKVRKNATKTYGFGFPQRAAPCRKLAYVPRVIGFPVCCCPSKGLCPTAFRCRFAAAACCHGRSFPLYRRTGVLPSQRSCPR